MFHIKLSTNVFIAQLVIQSTGHINLSQLSKEVGVEGPLMPKKFRKVGDSSKKRHFIYYVNCHYIFFIFLQIFYRRKDQHSIFNLANLFCKNFDYET